MRLPDGEPMPKLKGQGLPISATVVTVILFAVMIMVGWQIFGTIANVTPHDQLYYNETVCSNTATACPQTTLLVPAHVPVLNDSTLICHANVTLAATPGGLLMTNTGNVASPCLSYTTYDNGAKLNLTNGSTTCDLREIRCTYTHDNANTYQQNYFDTILANAGGGWVLLAVAVIIFAAIGVIIAIYMLVGA